MPLCKYCGKEIMFKWAYGMSVAVEPAEVEYKDCEQGDYFVTGGSIFQVDLSKNLDLKGRIGHLNKCGRRQR